VGRCAQRRSDGRPRDLDCAVAAAMQRRARGARIRASEQHPMRAAEELTLTPGEVVLAAIFVAQAFAPFR